MILYITLIYSKTMRLLLKNCDATHLIEILAHKVYQ